MAVVKSFRIDANTGVPDAEVKDFISFYEKEAIVNVSVTFIPAYGTFQGRPADPRVLVIVTKLDEKR